MMNLPFGKNKYNMLPVDMVFGVAAFYMAFYFRFDGNIPALFFASFQKLFVVYALLKPLVFYFLGVYRRVWKYAGAGDLLLVAYAMTVTALGLVTASYLMMVAVPRSVFFITWMIDLMLSGGARAIPKLATEKGFILHSLRNVKRLLVVGAGDAGVLVVKELFRQEDPRLLPVGFIDDDPNKQNLRIMGLPVLGTREKLERIVKDNNVHEVLIAMPSAPGQVIREIVEKCRDAGVPVRTLPRMYDIINGQVTVDLIREVKLEDLLGREPVKLDLDGIDSFIRSKSVLVTGAGGSIGSELCRQICRYGPGRLILLGHDENPIFEIELELGDRCSGIKTVPVIADIKDERRINQVFAEFRPQIVFHAAAHKHVPLMEHNPGEAYKNNVLGTRNVAEAADRHGTENFILISTDKAVNPCSVMGATKRIAEMIIQGINETSSTSFAAVRFGNVLGSRGSVIPIFQEQIRRGGPVTITHPEMCRYFMTIPEAVELVLQAASMAQGGEIFILDMGEPVRIVDMAKELIRLSGLEPDKDIEIKYVGPRPGEKLFEEILTDEEGVTATKIQRIFIAREHGINRKELDNLLAGLSLRQIPDSREEIFALLASIDSSNSRYTKMTAM